MLALLSATTGLQTSSVPPLRCIHTHRRAHLPMLTNVPNTTESTAFAAFASEVDKSPLLKRYGKSAVEKAAAATKTTTTTAKEESKLEDEFDAGLEYGMRLRARFFAPRVDDPGLPLADALVCIGGCLFIAQWALNPAVPAELKIPPPSWLAPMPMPPGNWRGLPYILPALVHGSELAVCWVLGALAASAYEAEAYMGSLQEALSRTWRAGAFAVGVLLLSTQLATYITLSSQGLDPYTIPSTEGIDSGARADGIILRTAFEVLCDVAVQAVQLTLFRAYRWRDAQGGPPPGGGNRRGRRRGQPQRPDYDADEYNPLKL